MAGPQVLVREKEEKKRVATPKGAEAVFGWQVLGWTGILFLIVGGVDFALAWYPSDFGNAEWEFGTVTAALSGLPIVVLGAVLWMVAAARLGSRWSLAGSAVVTAALVVVVAGSLVLYGLTIPLALDAAPNETISLGMKKAISRTVVQAVAYALVLTVLAAKSWKLYRRI